MAERKGRADVGTRQRFTASDGADTLARGIDSSAANMPPIHDTSNSSERRED